MIHVKVVSDRFWEVERKIADKLGTEVWVKCPPRDEDLWEKRKKKKVKNIHEDRIQKFFSTEIGMGFNYNKVIANRFDPLIANKKLRIAIDFRTPSRVEKKILDVFYWSWFVLDFPVSDKGLQKLSEVIKKELNEKENLFTVQA